MSEHLNFQHLPDSVLLHIFNFLPHLELANAARVSKRWRRVSYDGALWKNLDLQSISEENIKEIITKRSCSLLSQLNLNKCTLTPEFMVTVTGKCRQLKELTLQKCFFTRPERRFRLHVLRKLKTLDARLLRGNGSFGIRLLRCTPNLENLAVDDTIGAGCYGKILQRMSKLLLLDLSRCVELTDEDLELIADSCPDLESLLLNKCFKLYGYSLPVLLRNCKKLKTLSLAYTRVTDEYLHECNWKNLAIEEINFSSCYFVSSRGIDFVLSRLTELKYINLSNCSEASAVTPRILSEMARFKNLQVLNIDDSIVTFDENEELVCKIAQNCPKISCLLVGVTLRTASCLERCLRCLTELKRFAISYYTEHDDHIFNPHRVDVPPGGFGLDMILNNLATYCHKLEALQLSGYRDRECEEVTNAFVHLLRNCTNLSRICSFGGNTDILVMAADAEMQTGRQDVRLIKPTMLFPTPTEVTTLLSLCFDRVVYNKEHSTIDDPWRGPFVYEVQRNRRFWVDNAYR